MNARTLAIAGLVAAAVTAAAFYAFRSPESQAPEIAASASPRRTAEVLPAAGERAEETSARECVVDAVANAEQRSGSAESRQPPPPLPQPPLPTPMADALGDIQLPPIPELLETERKFAAESVDPFWSVGMESRILGEISGMTGLQLVGLRVECRTSLCRVQMSDVNAPGAARRPFNELVATFGLDTKWVMALVDRNGIPTSLAYLARRDAPSAER